MINIIIVHAIYNEIYVTKLTTEQIIVLTINIDFRANIEITE